jgi:hypothetical protein
MTNTLRTRAFRVFLAASIRYGFLPMRRVFPDAPGWHTACKCRRNGTKHETSRILPCVSHPVSPLARVVLVASILGCGGVVGSNPPQLPPYTITVGLAPSTVSVLLGETQAFSATVSNTADTAVIWSVDGIPGGNSTVGTIDTSGVYTAPANLPSPVSVSVQAASAADNSKSAAARVTITSDISVSVMPQTTLVELGASRTFTATVNSAGNPDRAVIWVISGGACSGAACGTVDSSGAYTAPQVLIAPPGVSIAAVSVADPPKGGAAAITITSTFSLAVAGPSSVSAGSSANFTATLTPVTGSNPSRMISWSVSGTSCAGASCGTITSGGVYTAPSIPPSPATVQIIATPQADSSKAASISVSILAAIGVSILPSAAAVPLGAAQAFQATVTGAPNVAVTWDVNGIVGGNSSVGSILNSASAPDNTIYTAPQILPAGGSVTVHATTDTNPAVSASATITFTTAINVTLSPASATLAVNQRQTFTVQVNNTPNQSVAWQVNGIPGGNATSGQICLTGSNPCLAISTSNSASVDFLAPPALPSPNPVTIVATSLAGGTESAAATVTILAHIGVSVQPASASIGVTGQLQFTASVTGTNNPQVAWSISGAGCGQPGACGSVNSTGLYTAPAAVPSPALDDVVATSSADTSQSGTATVTITGSPDIFSISPTSSYAGSAGGFILLASGSNFSPSSPGPASTFLVAGTARTTSCASSVQCTTTLAAADLQSAGSLTVQLQNPNGSISNALTFVALAPGSGAATIALTPGSPISAGNDIVVVELTSNGGLASGESASLNIAAIGAYSVGASSCVLDGSPVVITRPASGTGTADLCVFSGSGLDPSFTYTISGPPSPDITIGSLAALSLGIVHVTLQVPATAAPGPRTLFVENPQEDEAAGTGAIEVR